MLVFIALAFLIYKAFQLWSSRHVRTRAWWLGLAAAAAALAMLAVVVRSDIVASKMLALLVMPAGAAWLIMIVATVASWRRSPRALTIALAAATVLYALAGNVWLGAALMGGMERRIPPIDPATVPAFDAVFVLGGGTETTAEGLPEFGGAGDRLAVAAQLFHAGKAPRLVSSGSSIASLEEARDLAQETATLWRGLGVPADAIITLPPTAIITSTEVASYRDVIASHGWRRVGLISSAWHLPRALRTCARLGLSMVPIGADRHGRIPGLAAYWLIPQERGFRDVQLACWEWLGMLMGR